MSRAFIESDRSKHCLFVCRIAAALFFFCCVFRQMGYEKFSPQSKSDCNQLDLCLFYAFSRLSVFRSACVCVCVMGGSHVRNSDSYTTFGGKQTPQETLMHPPAAAAAAGEVCRPECRAFIHPRHFCPYMRLQGSPRIL